MEKLLTRGSISQEAGGLGELSHSHHAKHLGRQSGGGGERICWSAFCGVETLEPAERSECLDFQSRQEVRGLRLHFLCREGRVYWRTADSCPVNLDFPMGSMSGHTSSGPPSVDSIITLHLGLF